MTELIMAVVAVRKATSGLAEIAVEAAVDTERLKTEQLNTKGDFVFGLNILTEPVVVRNALAVYHANWILQAREETGEV